MSVEGNLWYVKLGDGDVERMTLDELDEAFQGGRIDENNMILAAGSDQWMRLSDLLGLADATPPPPPPTPAPHQAAQAARTAATQPAAPTRMPPLPMMRAPSGPVPAFAGATSLRPVSFDLGAQVDFNEVQFPRPSRRGWVVGALGTALVLGAGAFFVVSRTAGSASAEATPPTFAAAAALPSPVQETAPTPVTPPQTTNAGPSSVMDPTQHLTVDQKQKLLDADKKVKSHPKSHGGGGSVSSGSPKSSSKSTSFTTTGSKYDPLNSSL